MILKRYPLMRNGTAIWLVENTSLTFKQIANFCGLHTYEVQGIADGDIYMNVHSVNPIANKDLTKEEVKRCEGSPELRLLFSERSTDIAKVMEKNHCKRKYVSISSRQNKPDAILWILVNHPQLTTTQIKKLVGSTKNTIEQIRNKTYWKKDLKPKDPVLYTICTQVDLDNEVQKAQKLEAKKEIN
jgi:hypothetical protein